MKSMLNRSSESTRRAFIAKAASASLGVGLSSPSFALEKGSSEIQKATAKRVIYLYMAGGMSHLDTFDVKPGNNPRNGNRIQLKNG